MSIAYTSRSLVQGLILVVVGDIGPDIVANLSPISDDDALITALHLVSLAGLEGDDISDDESKMIGPLPVKGTKSMKSLYYSDMLKATNAQDHRLIEHGSRIGVILLFETDQLPEIRRAAGLIEPYLQLYLNKITETGELTKDFAIRLKNHVIELVSRPRLRTFWMDEEKIYEYKDPNYMKREHDVLILDETDKKMYMLTQKTTSPFLKRKMRNMVDELNFQLYKGGYSIITLESFGEIEPLLMKHNIRVRSSS